jgi:hypothetical protein
MHQLVRYFFSLLALTAVIGPRARRPLSSGRHPEPNAESQVATHNDDKTKQQTKSSGSRSVQSRISYRSTTRVNTIVRACDTSSLVLSYYHSYPFLELVFLTVLVVLAHVFLLLVNKDGVGSLRLSGKVIKTSSTATSTAAHATSWVLRPVPLRVYELVPL